MQLLLLESGKKLLQTAECAALSILAHGLLGVVCHQPDLGWPAASRRRAGGPGVLPASARPGGRAGAAIRDHPTGQAGRRPAGRRVSAQPGPGLGKAADRARLAGQAEEQRRQGTAALWPVGALRPGHRLQRPRGGRNGAALRVERGADLSQGPSGHGNSRRRRGHLRGGHGGPGRHHYGPRDVQRRSSFHRFGNDGARRDALPSGQAQRQDGATAGAAEVPLPDRARSQPERMSS